MHIVDKVMIGVMLLSVVILVVCILLSGRGKMANEDEITKLGRKLRNRWLGSSLACLIVYYWCVLISLLSTMIVLYLGCFEDTGLTAIKGRMILYSAFSLFTTVCPYVINFIKLSKKFRSAFCIVEEQLLTQGNVGSAIIAGEEIIATAFEE